MTVEEAIDFFEKELNEKGYYNFLKEQMHAYIWAIEALKLQVPIKPIVDETICDTDSIGREIEPHMQTVYICPKCKRVVTIYERCKCGQRILWE